MEVSKEQAEKYMNLFHVVRHLGPLRMSGAGEVQAEYTLQCVHGTFSNHRGVMPMVQMGDNEKLGWMLQKSLLSAVPSHVSQCCGPLTGLNPWAPEEQYFYMETRSRKRARDAEGDVSDDEMDAAAVMDSGVEETKNVY